MSDIAQVFRLREVYAVFAKNVRGGRPVIGGVGERGVDRREVFSVFEDSLRHCLQHTQIGHDLGKIVVRKTCLKTGRRNE